MRKKKNPNEMDLSGHVKELKHRMMFVLVVFLVVFIAAYIKSNDLMNLITSLGKSIGYKFIYLAPQEVIVQQFRIAGVTALICDLPIIVYEIVAFIAPVFSSKKSFIGMLFIGFIALVLFLLGTIFAYEILLPFVYRFLYETGQTSKITAQISIKEYITLFITLESCIGIVTEMPLICIMLTKVGILTPDIMVKIRAYIIVVIFIIAAIITPPDAVSQMMVAIPMICLYQVSIILCKFIKGGKRHGKRNKSKE